MPQPNTALQAGETSLIPFEFEGSAFRVVEQNGEPWFVGNDVCHALKLADAKQAIEKLDPDERGRCSVPTPSGGQEMRVVNESGLYTLILRCRDAVVPGTVPHRLRKWVTGEVLPSIRKHGRYGAPDPLAVLNDATSLRTLLLASAERELALKSQLDDMQPKIEAHDRIAESHGTFCRSTAAKMLGVPPLTLIRWLRTNGWTFRRPGDKDDLAYQSKIAAGLLEHKITTGQKPDGTEWSSTQVRVTPKGLTVLAKAFPPPVQEA